MIVFYEKPGCINNTRQKSMLTSSEVQFVSRNLLSESWSFGRLRPFFGDKPVEQWFNQSAPQVKSGEIDPRYLLENDALKLMIQNPILIRRPLIEIGEIKTCGFDWDWLKQVLLIDDQHASRGDKVAKAHDLEACANTNTTANAAVTL